ncbi:unnamed protein product [Cylindrotheca closterium]|uniref:DUF6824 domain-containing protein n=1 Tax=Cylindrotheca closterium TaxID=2856 RepID=A0AAD2CT00_9STRA|nr:unnamed protein product [Cylindrotheca closterium]
MESGDASELKRKALNPSASRREQAGNAESIDASSANPSEPSGEAGSRSNAVAILLPADNYILFGRGKSCNNHPGNKEMRRNIERYRDQYQLSARGEKYKLVRKVYDELVEAGMKFLKPAEGQDGWVEVDAEAAILKVGHALRSSRGGSTSKAAKSGHVPVGDGDFPGTNTGANAGESLQNSSIAAPTGTVQQQWAGLQGLPGWSSQMSTSLPTSTGFAQEGAGEALQHYLTAAQSGNVQEQIPGLQAAIQALTGLPTPGGRGASMGDSLLPQDTAGIGGNDTLNILEHYRKEMELEGLRSWLLGPNGPTTLTNALSSLNPNELYAMAEHDEQLRQLLMLYVSRKTGAYSGQSGEGGSGPFDPRGYHQ